MAGELVLITGGTGHVGFKVIVDALKAGYRVRAAIRSLSKSSSLLATESIKALNPGDKLTFVEVPDIVADGAYDEAVKGVDYIIHIASPLSTTLGEGDDLEALLMGPAVRGTIGIYESAHKVDSVKRIVVTSSVVAIMPLSPENVVYNELSRTPFEDAPYQNGFQAYSASKQKSLNAAEAWIAENKPAFDSNFIYPGFVLGPNELVTTKEQFLASGTSRLPVASILGRDQGYLPSLTVHLDDVSLAHVLALDPKVPGGSGFILSSADGIEGSKWENVFDFASKNFPKEVESGVLPNSGAVKTFTVKMDDSATEKLFGRKLINFEEQVKSVVGQYLALP